MHELFSYEWAYKIYRISCRLRIIVGRPKLIDFLLGQLEIAKMKAHNSYWNSETTPDWKWVESPTGKTSLIPKRESSLYTTIARRPRSAAQEKQGVWQSETLSLRLCIRIEHYEDEGKISFRFCFLCFQLQLVDLSQGFRFWLFRSCDFGLTPLCDALIWKSEPANLWVLDQEANFWFFFFGIWSLRLI